MTVLPFHHSFGLAVDEGLGPDGLHRLAGICDVMAGGAPEAALLPQLCAAICHYSDWAICAILATERETGTNRLVARYDPFEMRPRATAWPLRGSPVQRVLASGKPLVLQDVDRSERYPDFASDAVLRGYTTLMLVPLVLSSSDPVHYCLSLKRIERRGVDAAEMGFVHALARMVAMLMRRLALPADLAARLTAAEAQAALQAELAALAAEAGDRQALLAGMARLQLPSLALHGFPGRQQILRYQPEGIALQWPDQIAPALWSRLGALQAPAAALDLPPEKIGAPFVAVPLRSERGLVGALVMAGADHAALPAAVRCSLQACCAIVLGREEARSTDRQEHCRFLVQGVLTNPTGADLFVGDLRRCFGIDLVKAAEVIAIRPAPDLAPDLALGNEDLAHRLNAGLRLLSLPPTAIDLDGTVWLLGSAEPRASRGIAGLLTQLRRETGEGILLARGRTGAGQPPLDRLMARSRRLLDHAATRGLRGEISAATVTDSDLLLSMIDPGAASDFVAAMLGRLGGAGTGSDHETLRAFLAANGQLTACAAALGIHVTTLRYRLARICDRTGFEAADPAQRFALDMALRLQELAPPSPGDPTKPRRESARFHRSLA